MNAPDHDIIKSSEAKIMRQMVTPGFYDGSRTALWIFEAIGREYDDMAEWSRALRYEAFPHTCTWSIGIWEREYGFEYDGTLSLEERRQRFLSRRLKRPPLNPARVEALLFAIAGYPVQIEENVAPYSFAVEVYTGSGEMYDLRKATKALRKIKPSHLSFVFVNMIVAECVLYSVPAACSIRIEITAEVKLYGMD
jgi:hypothetical protein